MQTHSLATLLHALKGQTLAFLIEAVLRLPLDQSRRIKTVNESNDSHMFVYVSYHSKCCNFSL